MAEHATTGEAPAVRYYRLAEAARQFLPWKDGKPQNPAALNRAILKGVKLRDGSRRKLRARWFPCGWGVTQEDVEAFLAALTRDRLGAEPAAPPRVPAARRRAHEAAERELDRIGI
jgi:hypothetical protein